MNFKAAVFDLDGTLLDTLADLAAAMNAALEGMGFAAHPTAAYRYFVGEGIEMLVRRTLPKDQADEATVARGVQAMGEQYSRCWADQSQPYPGVAQLLDNLTAQGVALAILSNKPEEFTQLTVDKLLPSWHFNPVRGARPDIPRKPDPAGALLIAESLKVNPAQCLYLGDTATDMQTANAAGMYAVGATWGFRPAAELQANGARTLAQKPEDVLNLFNG
jgi:phosphoglycolate phosphatase